MVPVPFFVSRGPDLAVLRVGERKRERLEGIGRNGALAAIAAAAALWHATGRRSECIDDGKGAW
jgi:hypothetical protein